MSLFDIISYITILEHPTASYSSNSLKHHVATSSSTSSIMYNYRSTPTTSHSSNSLKNHEPHHPCNDPPPRGRARLHLAALEDPKNIPTDQHMSFLCTLSSLMRTREGFPGRSPIAPR
jgi:hypothetical protein